MAKSKDQKSEKSFRKKKNLKKNKSLGLFDHVKQVQKIQDPNYFNNLSDAEKESFNHFMILRALSMNPDNLEYVSLLYRYSNIIPSPQFYKLLISLFPSDPNRYQWIKPRKKYKDELISIISKNFEIPNQQAKEYIDLLLLTDEGKKSLVYICQGEGKSDDEVEELLSNDDNE